MSDFQNTYLKLLRNQVDEEIAFLVRNGHDNERISVPCMFCTNHPSGYHRCYRLNELRRFQSSIVQHEATENRKLDRNVPKARRSIGFDERPVIAGVQEPALNSEVRLTDQPLLNLQF